MSGFRNRMDPALVWEETVLADIRSQGWTACRYGQGMLTGEVRDALHSIKTPLRWHPDILAIRGDVAYFVDAKTGRTDTPNHAIEKASLAALHDWYRAMRIPTVLVWETAGTPDCAFTWDLREPHLRAPSWRGNGSGTDYWLWPAAQCIPFDAVFGPNAEVFGPPAEWRMEALRTRDQTERTQRLA